MSFASNVSNYKTAIREIAWWLNLTDLLSSLGLEPSPIRESLSMHLFSLYSFSFLSLSLSLSITTHLIAANREIAFPSQRRVGGKVACRVWVSVPLLWNHITHRKTLMHREKRIREKNSKCSERTKERSLMITNDDDNHNDESWELFVLLLFLADDDGGKERKGWNGNTYRGNQGNLVNNHLLQVLWVERSFIYLIACCLLLTERKREGVGTPLCEIDVELGPISRCWWWCYDYSCIVLFLIVIKNNKAQVTGEKWRNGMQTLFLCCVNSQILWIVRFPPGIKEESDSLTMERDTSLPSVGDTPTPGV